MKRDDVLSKFGGHLRSLRHNRGWTQQQVAAESGLSVDGIRRIEAGGFAPSLTTLVKLSKALRVPVVSLVAGVDRPRPGDVERLSDFLASLPDDQLKVAAKMLYALGAAPGETGRRRTEAVQRRRSRTE